MEEATFVYSESCVDNLYILCNVCNMGLNGLMQWEDHKIGRKHKKNLKPKEPEPKPKVIVPTGTVIIIEQTAIYYDAVQRYTLTLYERGLLRSRLWSKGNKKKKKYAYITKLYA